MLLALHEKFFLAIPIFVPNANAFKRVNEHSFIVEPIIPSVQSFRNLQI